MGRRIRVAVAAAGVVALSGCGAAAGVVAGAVDGSSRLEQVAEECLLGSTADDGMSISFDTQGEEDYASDGPYDTVEDIACALNELETPDYVVEHMDNTRALDGQQTDEWDTFEARWSYHPDNGFEMTIIDRS